MSRRRSTSESGCIVRHLPQESKYPCWRFLHMTVWKILNLCLVFSSNFLFCSLPPCLFICFSPKAWSVWQHHNSFITIIKYIFFVFMNSTIFMLCERLIALQVYCFYVFPNFHDCINYRRNILLLEEWLFWFAWNWAIFVNLINTLDGVAVVWGRKLSSKFPYMHILILHSPDTRFGHL